MSDTLFDFLPAEGPDVLCGLMPWMATACGRCVCGGCRQCAADGCACVLRPAPAVTLGPYSAVTCPDCLAAGDLPALARASQTPARMAPVVA